MTPHEGRDPATPVRLALAEHHNLTRTAIRRALEGSEGVDVVGEAGTCDEVAPLVAAVEPDVLLLDVSLPVPDGLACLAQVRRRFPQLPVVMLGAASRRDLARRAAEAGARAYASKTVPPAVLLELVRDVASSGPGEFLTRGLEDATAGDAAALLTKRELVVLAAIGRGLSTRQIARELWVTAATVKFHVRNIYAKLGCENRAEAAAYARREGLVDERQRS